MPVQGSKENKNLALLLKISQALLDIICHLTSCPGSMSTWQAFLSWIPVHFTSPLRKVSLLPEQLAAPWPQLTTSSGSAAPNSSLWSRWLYLLLSFPSLTKGALGRCFPCPWEQDRVCWLQHSSVPHFLAIFPIDSGWKVINYTMNIAAWLTEGWPKCPFWFFYKMLPKNPNEHFGQPNVTLEKLQS